MKLHANNWKYIIFLSILFPLTIFGLDNKSQNPADISKHYAALPVVYTLADITKEEVADKATRQYVMGSRSMLVKWTLKKGAVIPMHFHPNEQITWITQGSVKVLSQGKEFIVKAGQVMIIPPYVPHEFHALEDTIDIDYFTPVRNDWLQGTPSYLQPSTTTTLSPTVKENQAPLKQEIITSEAPAPIGIYSQATKMGNTIYLAGEIPLNPITNKLAVGTEAQVEQVFQNLSAVAKAAGGNLNQIVKLTIYLKNLDDIKIVNTVMPKYFSKPYPARSTISVSSLAKDAAIEVEGIMVIPNGE